jgi:hypothetical protein
MSVLKQAFGAGDLGTGGGASPYQIYQQWQKGPMKMPGPGLPGMSRPAGTGGGGNVMLQGLQSLGRRALGIPGQAPAQPAASPSWGPKSPMAPASTTPTAPPAPPAPVQKQAAVIEALEKQASTVAQLMGIRAAARDLGVYR